MSASAAVADSEGRICQPRSISSSSRRFVAYDFVNPRTQIPNFFLNSASAQARNYFLMSSHSRDLKEKRPVGQRPTGRRINEVSRFV
jgi:hypothetical protein